MPNAVALKVLVVDDQNSVRQMTRMTLEEIGIRHIHEAENGVQAMETASLQPIDLIISDYNMPEMDGLGLLRAVRGSSGRAPGPVHPAHRPRRQGARRQGGAGGRQQLPDQAVHDGDLAQQDRAGHGETVVTAAAEISAVSDDAIEGRQL